MRHLRIIASAVGLSILLTLGACGGGGGSGGGGGGGGAASPAPGSLDAAFGASGTGIVTTQIGNSSNFANAVALQSDGKIVVAGYFYNGITNGFALARYNANGSLDTGFGPNGTGIVVPPIDGVATAVAIQSDGKIVVAGYGRIIDQFHIALARYGANGNLDAGFGTNGIVITVINTQSAARAIAIQSDGKIVVAGSTVAADLDFMLVRYNTNGSRDNGFGTIGIVTAPRLGADSANAIAIQSDGKIVVAGFWGALFTLTRYNTNGGADATFGTFGTSGIVITQIGVGDEATALAIQSDGKIVAAGYGMLLGSVHFALVRYDTGGNPDTTFGESGIAVTPVGFGGAVQGVAIQGNGKIVVAGEAHNGHSTDDFALVRYNANGNLDTGFGTNGIVITPISDSAGAHAVALQADGKIVAAGYAGNSADFAVARYHP